MPTKYDKASPPMLNAELLLGSREAAQSLGCDLTDLAASCGVSLQTLESGEGQLPLHQVVDFLNRGAQRFRSEHFGLLIAKYQPPARFAMVGQLIRFSETLECAINDAIRFSLLNSEYSDWTIEREQDVAILVRRTRVAYDAPTVQLQTLALAVVYKAINSLCQGKVRLLRVQFTHKQPRQPDPVEDFFGASVYFNQDFTGLVLPEAELRRAIPTRDPNVHRLLVAHLRTLARGGAPHGDLVARVKHEIKRQIGSRHCSIRGVSRRLGIHPRAMQRALQQHSLSFRQLLQDVRQELAEDYFRNSSLSVLELADLLGYRNASAFSRAFKLRTGMSPQHWKVRHAS